MNLGVLVCAFLGCDFPPIATWRWSRRAAKRETPDGRGKGYGMQPLGARARRRERVNSRTCQRCGRRLESSR
jgi:hypothetical protein